MSKKSNTAPESTKKTGASGKQSAKVSQGDKSISGVSSSGTSSSTSKSNAKSSVKQTTATTATSQPNSSRVIKSKNKNNTKQANNEKSNKAPSEGGTKVQKKTTKSDSCSLKQSSDGRDESLSKTTGGDALGKTKQQVSKFTSTTFMNPMLLPSSVSVVNKTTTSATPNIKMPAPFDPVSSDSVTSQMSVCLSEAFDGRALSSARSSPPKSEEVSRSAEEEMVNTNGQSIPILTTSPSRDPELQLSPQASLPPVWQSFDSETSISDKVRVRETKLKIKVNKVQEFSTAMEPLSSTPSTITPTLDNYFLSLTSLQTGKCGSGAPQVRFDSAKRHLISVRNGLDGTAQPIGVLYGSVKSYLNCSANVTHMLVRIGLLTPVFGSGQVSLDICLVDQLDYTRQTQLSKFECKKNLVTVSPLHTSQVLLYDQTGRGIELEQPGQLKFDGDRVALAVATIGQLPAKVTPNNRHLEVGSLERNIFDHSKARKVEVHEGMVTLMLGSFDGQRNIAMGLSPFRMDLVVVMQQDGQQSQPSTISMDDCKAWQVKAHPFTLLHLPLQSLTRDSLTIQDCQLLTSSDVEYARVVDFPLEYLLYIKTQQSSQPIGTVLGRINGPFNIAPVTLANQVSGLRVRVQSIPVNCNDFDLMAQRRTVLNSPKLVIILVGASAQVNIFSDLGDGYQVAPDARLCLATGRLYRLIAAGPQTIIDKTMLPVLLSQCRMEEVTYANEGGEGGTERLLELMTGEYSLVITDGGNTLAYFRHPQKMAA